MKRSAASVLSAILCSVLMLLSINPATAQGTVPDKVPSLRTDISDQKLDHAAAAIVDITKVHDAYGQKLEYAPPEKKEKVAQEARAATLKAVTDQGLTIDELNSIMEIARNDPDVEHRLAMRVGSAQQ